MAMTVSFHNGRKGASGAYDVKHNDREFESPYPNKKPEKFNNRKMVFDALMRERLKEIAEQRYASDSVLGVRCFYFV